MTNTLTKRVSLIELFYDLVFVYMISRATELLHHLHHGMLDPITIVIFFLVIIVFINSWMIQMVFTNRYGKLSWNNVIFSFIDMAILLYMSNSFTKTFDRHLAFFFIAAGLLSLTLSLQYLVTYFQEHKQVDKRITAVFAGIMGVRTIALLIGGIWYSKIGIIIALTGIFFGWLAPALTGNITKHHPIIFSHLLERLTALIIIMFGETIVGIAQYFTQENFGLTSIYIFIVVVGLFFNYIVEFDHLIDERQKKETGNALIYLHYFIIFGISLVTVALKFINEDGANETFSVTILYLGILLFYIGIQFANSYNHPRYKISWILRTEIILITLIGYVISLWLTKFIIISLIVAIVVFLNVSLTVIFYERRLKQHI